MAIISSLRDDELDKLLAGRTPNGRRELAPIADVATAIRRQVAEEPAPVMSYQLRNAVARGATPAVVRPRRLLPVAVAAFAIAGVGLAGAANALPSPVQNVVSDAGDLVGVDIPSASDDDLVDTRDTGDGTTIPSAEDEGLEDKGDGPPETTQGGATPADPGTPGDKEPATPAVPPEHSNGGNENGTGPGSSNGGGNANGHTSERDPNGNGNGNGNADG